MSWNQKNQVRIKKTPILIFIYKIFFSELKIHIDVFSAQTGISRFMELNRVNWVYDKIEGLKPGSKEMLNFSHLLIEAESDTDPRLQPYKSSHKILYFVKAYNGIYLSRTFVPMVKIKKVPKIFILKKL